ncbi:MAG: response regulator [Rhodothermales bacterium]
MDIGLLELTAAMGVALSLQNNGNASPEPIERALDRAKSRVLVNLLNDLRTPLMMIKAPLESGDGITPEDVHDPLDHANQLQRGLERAIKIIQMDAETGGGDEDGGGAGATDLVDAVSYFVSSMRPRAERRRVEVVFQSQLRSGAVAMPWPRVELLLESVTDYALRGFVEGGRLTVSLDRAGDGKIALAILSNGRFEPLEPAKEQVEEVGDPLTLGLLLGRRYLRRHGGTLEFVHVGDEMACRIVLPAADVSDEPEAPLHSSEDETPSDRETTVLVVDDHPGTRAYLRFALRKHHRIVEASDGQEALEVVREEMPDLVISDIMMPVMDGNELCRAIKTDEALNHIPVFLVTANSIRTLRTESLESGADDFLVKPFDVKEAVMRINNEIRMRRDLRSRYSREVVIKPSDITVTSEDEAFINRAREIVEEHIGDADFSIQDLSSDIGMSSRQLQRRLRETLDQSPVEFVRSLRLQRAAQLLGGQYGNVSEVAYAVGFTSLSYFAKCFKEEYGVPPSTYKDDHDQGGAHEADEPSETNDRQN